MGDKELWVRIRANASELEAELKKSASVVNSVGRRLQGIGRQLTVGVTAPLAAIAAGATRAQLSAEDAFTEMAKTVEAPVEQLQALRDRFEDLSENKIPRTANELTRLAALGGQLGITTDALSGFVETVAALDIATDLGAEDAATGLAQFSNVMGTAQGNLDRLGSTIVDLGNNLATTESRILDMGLRLAGAGRQVGLTEAQVLAFAGALSSAGLEAQAGGSAFSKVFSTMAQAAAGGGAQLERFARVAGMSSAEFAKAFREDAAQAVVEFLKGLRGMSDEGRNVFGVLESLELGERRVTDAVLRSAGSIDTVVGALERGSRAWSENTALTEEARKFYERAGADFERLKNEAINVAAEFGETLMPSFRNVLGVGRTLIDTMVRPLIEVFAALPAPIQTTTIAFVGIAAAMGPVLIIGGQLIQTMVALKGATVALAGATGLRALAALLLPGGAILAGLALLGGTLIAVAGNADGATRRVRDLRKAIEELDRTVSFLDEKELLAAIGEGRDRNREIDVELVRKRRQRADAIDRQKLLPQAFGGQSGIDQLDREIEQLEKLRQDSMEGLADARSRLEKLRQPIPGTAGVGGAGGGAGGGEGGPDKVVDALKRLDEALVSAERKAALLGDEFDRDQAVAAAYEAALDALAPLVSDVDQKLAGSGQTLRGVADAYEAARDRAAALREEQERREAIRSTIENLERQNVELRNAAMGLATYSASLDGAIEWERTWIGILERSNEQIERNRQIQEDAAAAVERAVEGARQIRIGEIVARFEEVQRAAASMAQGMADALLGFATRTQNLADTVKQAVNIIIRELLRLQLQQTLIGPLTSFLSSILPGGGIPDAPGPITVDPPKFAHGGRFGRGTLALVGERGPELVDFDAPGRVIPHDRIGSLLEGGKPVREVHQAITFKIDAIDGMSLKRAVLQQAGTIMAIVRKGTREGLD